MQSLVLSLSPNNLIPFTIYFYFVYISFDKNRTLPKWQSLDPSGLIKMGPLRIGKIGTPPDWQKKDPSGLAKLGPLRIGKSRNSPDWQNWDPSGLAKMGPFWIGISRTPPDWQNWDPFGLAKLAFPGFFKISPVTIPDTLSDAVLL